jgi:hypothetical protein
VGTVETSGTVDYHALLAKLQRRFARGFSFLVSYTYGKAIDLTSDNDGAVTLTNVYDPGYNRGPADYDVTHTLSASWIYDLPFAGESRLGGWQVNGIVYWRTGLPVTITQTGVMLSTGAPATGRIGSGTGRPPIPRSTSGSIPPRSAGPRSPRPPSAARAGTSCAAPASSTWTRRWSSSPASARSPRS